MTDRRTAIGIIGAGIMGERFLRGVLDLAPEILRVSGVWDPASAARGRIAAVLPDVSVLADAAAVIASADCVYIASPPASHLVHARAALAAGKVFFSEKPLAVDVADARALVTAAGGKGAVNFPFASSVAAERLARWIDAGAVGIPSRLHIEVAFANWPRSWQVDAASWLDRSAEGGFTREVVSHFLFLARRLIGPLHGLDARAEFPEPGRAERRIQATLKAGDLPVAIAGSVGTTPKDDHNVWTLEGSAGAVRLCDWIIAERRLPDGTWQADPDAPPRDQLRPRSLRRQLEGVLRFARGEPHQLATLAEALNVQEIVEGVIARG